jgi:hypothetical protein
MKTRLVAFLQASHTQENGNRLNWRCDLNLPFGGDFNVIRVKHTLTIFTLALWFLSVRRVIIFCPL